MEKINVIGAGLAGSEAALYIANKGIRVDLYEMRPIKKSEAHTTNLFGELVCSNSLKNTSLENASGLLKAEMHILNSVVLESASRNSVPAGASLSVDRELFSTYITNKINANPLIKVINKEVVSIEEGITIIATGPLTSEELTKRIVSITGSKQLHFFDASAPIIEKDSINLETAYFKSRFEKGDADYLNCAMNEQEYLNFYNELINAKLGPIHDFDKVYFEGCMPVEVIAKRGLDTLRYGPLNYKGLRKDENHRPHAVVQLRQDNVSASLYNLVGFQTNLTYGEQKRVFRLIPGLENAEFVRYGLMHRNTFVNAPTVLNKDGSLKNNENIFIAGQLSGVEGYVESAASGIFCAINAVRKLRKQQTVVFPRTTMIGSLMYYLNNANPESFSPMNANFGIVEGVNKKNRLEFSQASLLNIQQFIVENSI